MTEKTRNLLKYAGSRSGVTYGSCKVHKARVENWLLFWPIFLALNAPTCKLGKFLVPILKPLTTNEFTVKDSFHFAENVVDQQLDFVMGSLDVDSLFTNIPLKETIEIFTIEFFKESDCYRIFYYRKWKWQ